ncbi:hypothetical protein M378DRAFT_328945 [Amanita muscaria Koide BX008]|uniref:Uncharacterized protein n=1 Tax=Amanita muscaria (strain Koide BX008) TaxID=946122 RepID=A0A0C2TJF1_AMAMK|nr:hypothetical protein M378DRAFT_328945 [Amanita muscaria Koide BX008]
MTMPGYMPRAPCSSRIPTFFFLSSTCPLYCHHLPIQEVDYADMLMALWMRNAKKCPRQAQAKKADRSREKVRTWLEFAEP